MAIGEKYKELRKEQSITLAQAAKGICATSNLSRWENGKITLEFNKVLALLSRIHISPTEFIGYADIVQENDLPTEILKAIEEEDASAIKKLIHVQLDKYHAKRNAHDLYLAVILCNQYLLIKGEKLLPFSDQMHLYTYLSKITLWSTYNLGFFGNCVFMIKTDKVYAIAMNVLNNQDLIQKNTSSIGLISMMGVLSDATISLIFRKDIIHAHKLLDALQGVELPQFLEFFKVTLTFLEKTLQYLKTKDEDPILSFINNAQNMGMTESADTFRDVFEKVKILN
ncbi:helix-turn-helix domain-containing protein [Lactobacillus amylovorus]|uniref:Helix-turn-helix domain-containing protein n=1 Tax=Lactobacillus amylovorus TaxID=1604 RepID=A0A9X3W552_LACAM|nr:Rgg/GadR/MutR family transcriptional regulator [Lactobacillus amylovorus]CDA27073.1 transcriptional regulator [Lactobacillus amylovorus CAG:719]AUX16190.1 XRE family transcriptional regulator [Lactobacillus amylovorus]MCI7336161.1 helix-turn-helix domain-containing protein [Lactobacillus amylovorus]MDB6238230.1 helix-turn-helix domain-containing protein [Lactobacillus amylovorus]MDB6242785.1 helix-turn-helix domain-containing protein [Lactobacillus amylovorus]